MLHKITGLISFGLVVANLVAAVELGTDSTCSFSASSYTGPTEKYIVILKNQQNVAESHLSWLTKCSDRSVLRVTSETSLQSVNENQIEDFSVAGEITGYSGFFSADFVNEQLSKRDDTLIIEKDAPVKMNYVIPRAVQDLSSSGQDSVGISSVQNSAIPNLDRIDQAKFPLNGKYTYPDSAGAGVDVYVVDTGVLTTHSEFEGRATFAAAFCDKCKKVDDNGHGSHIAGIVAGKTFGVAKKANIIGVKVLDSQGGGSNSEVIKGLCFVLDQYTKTKKNSVVLLSLGGPLSKAMNLAVQKLTDAGVHVVVAAGNDSADACDASPSSARSAITVGATENSSDAITDFSNIGKCVDIFAPGRSIASVGITSDSAIDLFTGTSQAAPHVAGTVALIIAKNGNASPADMQQNLIKLGTKNVIPNAKAGTPNVFLRVPSS